ncbi:hypothetical protein MAJHIDBO_01308 [Propionibacterium freudenreichii subsp. shermanii]|nr:hypothetical protein MAJHIDBO_01308 [Propionibacterium freudenreichii subsp. shermanii]SPS09103.1 hypothetical protein MAJHIDBO_01308 [Propionibacterium freudenreichii subsp. shermanii]
MFSYTVFDCIRLNCWKIMPISGRTLRNWCSVMFVTSKPLTSTLPEVTFSSPLMSRTRVLLPAPE